MIDVKASILAVRAIGSQFGLQIWNQVALITALVAVISGGLLVWLISMSGWWWLLAVVFGIVFSVAITLMVVFRLLLNYVNPAQTSEQKQIVKAFAEKVQFDKSLLERPK